jgi:large subunit ribosomal protein L7/L12
MPAAKTTKKDGDRVDQAFDLIKEMTILELRDLNKRIEEEFGVVAAAPVAMAVAPAAAGPAPAAAPVEEEEEQTEFTVIL